MNVVARGGIVLVALLMACALGTHVQAAQKGAFEPARKAHAAQAEEAKDPPGPGIVGVVNINTASREELELLPGVGPMKSAAIVAYRSNKPFKDPKHLVRVKGIGRKTLHRILPFLVVEGPSTLKKK
jgi:competence protein ComEA